MKDQVASLTAKVDKLRQKAEPWYCFASFRFGRGRVSPLSWKVLLDGFWRDSDATCSVWVTPPEILDPDFSTRFNSLGFVVLHRLLDASQYGAPQSSDRGHVLASLCRSGQSPFDQFLF